MNLGLCISLLNEVIKLILILIYCNVLSYQWLLNQQIAHNPLSVQHCPAVTKTSSDKFVSRPQYDQYLGNGGAGITKVGTEVNNQG